MVRRPEHAFIPHDIQAVVTLVKASTFFDDVKEWSGLFFDAHQLGVRSNFDIDIKVLLPTSRKHDDVTNVKPLHTRRSSEVGTSGSDASANAV